jgi:cytochrome c-type biogenesis protein CcmH
MTTFYIAVATLVVVALALLLRPWWLASRRTAGADSQAVLNAAIHRDRLAELERDRAAGTLSDVDLAEAKEELQRQLLDDTAAAEPVPADRFSRSSGIAIAVLLPLVAVAVYALLGTPSAVLPSAVQAQRASADMEQLVEKLASKLEQNPDNPEGWAMLARSYTSMGRWDDAERAYTRLGPALGNSAELMAEFAEMLLQKNNGFDDRSRDLIGRALRLEPNNMLALFLGGGDAFAREQYAESVALWERLLPQLEPGGEDARMIESNLAKARERSGARAGRPATAQRADPGGNQGAQGKEKVTSKAMQPNAAAKSVSGRVELAPSLKDKAKPDDVVFIFARAVDGPRMPLAAQRARVADLPMDFMLDDGQALMPEATISSAAEVRVEVRVSKSGKATPGKGDLTGKSAAVKPGTKGLKIVIDQVDP